MLKVHSITGRPGSLVGGGTAVRTPVSLNVDRVRQLDLAHSPLRSAAYLSALLGPPVVVGLKLFWLDAPGDAPFLLLFGQIVLVGAVGGFLPALLATVVSSVCVAYVLLPPARSFALGEREAAQVLTFLVEGLAVSGLTGLLHHSWRSARESLDATRAANERVGQAWRQRTKLLAEASHEIRQPLSRLLTHLQLARRQLNKSDAETLALRLDAAIDAARALNRVANDLLDVTRAEAKFVTAFQPLDLGDLLRDVIRQCGGDGAQAGPLEVQLPPREIPITGDRAGLSQVLRNLMSNAIKYGGGGAVLVEASIDESRGEALLRVRDQGIGVPEEERARIFEPFYRASNAGAIRGHGLGLAISRGIVEQHRGRLWLEDTGQNGATFALSLPLRAAPPARGSVRLNDLML